VPGGRSPAVSAAVDWARCGRTDPITDDTLRRVWPSYLPPGTAATDDAFAVALAWAVWPVAGTIALLHRTGSYQAFDYVVRLVRDRSGAEPPRDAAWAAAIESAEDAQALAVAAAAYGHARLDAPFPDTAHTPDGSPVDDRSRTSRDARDRQKHDPLLGGWCHVP
jgi:hypothetical protein